MQQDKKLLIGTVAVAVLIFGGLVWALLSTSPSDVGPTDGNVTFSDENDPSVGPADAKVVVRLFSDLQCPACRAAEAGATHAIEKFKDRVRFVWNDFPLLQIHPNARLAANAARCAEDQGKFWEYKDVLFREQDRWSKSGALIESFQAYAAQLGLKADDFNTCLDARTHDGKVMADVSEGQQNRVDRTPTVFINNTRHFGLSPEDWDRLLNAALQQSGAGS